MSDTAGKSNTSKDSGLKEYRGLSLAISLAVFMAYLDGTIVSISLPAIAGDLKASSDEVSWVVLIYLLMQSSTLLFFGRLADIIGLRRLFISGYLVFSIGSLFCGLSPTLPVLIAARLIQGIGGSMLIIAAFAIVPRRFPASLTGTAFGVITTAAAIGTTAGAPIGGWISGSLSWPWIFLINIPIGVLAIINAFRVLPADPPSEKTDGKTKVSMDVPGMIFSFSGLLFLMYALNRAPSLGWKSGVILGCAGTGAILMATFLFWEKRCRSPLISLELFAIRPLLLAILSGSIAYSFLAGMTLLIPFYLVDIPGLSSNASGLVMMGYSIPLMFIGPFAGTLAGRIGSRPLCVGGMLLATAACFGFAWTLPMTSQLPALVFLVLLGTAFGFFNSPNNNHIKNVVPKKEQGSVFGVSQTAVRTSMAVGVSVFGAVFSQGMNLCQESSPAKAYQIVFLMGGVFCLVSAILAFRAMAKVQTKT